MDLVALEAFTCFFSNKPCFSNVILIGNSNRDLNARCCFNVGRFFPQETHWETELDHGPCNVTQVESLYKLQAILIRYVTALQYIL